MKFNVFASMDTWESTQCASKLCTAMWTHHWTRVLSCAIQRNIMDWKEMEHNTIFNTTMCVHYTSLNTCKWPMSWMQCNTCKYIGMCRNNAIYCNALQCSVTQNSSMQCICASLNTYAWVHNRVKCPQLHSHFLQDLQGLYYIYTGLVWFWLLQGYF